MKVELSKCLIAFLIQAITGKMKMVVSSVRIFNSLKPPSASLTAYSTVHSRSPSSLDCNFCRLKGGFVSSSISGSCQLRAIVRDKGKRTEDHPLVGDSTDKVDENQVKTHFAFHKFFYLLLF